MTPAMDAPPGEGDRARNLRTVARGGTLNLAGAVTNGVLGFLLTVVLAQGLSSEQLGAFFVSIALFQILANTAELGADTGFVRIIARYRALGRVHDLRRTIAIGLWPVLAIAVVFGVVVWAYAPELSNVFAKQAPPRLLVPYLRVLGPLVPAAAAFTVVLAATRGFGSMRPTVVLDKFVRAGMQVALEAAGGPRFRSAGPRSPLPGAAPSRSASRLRSSGCSRCSARQSAASRSGSQSQQRSRRGRSPPSSGDSPPPGASRDSFRWASCGSTRC